MTDKETTGQGPNTPEPVPAYIRTDRKTARMIAWILVFIWVLSFGFQLKSLAGSIQPGKPQRNRTVDPNSGATMVKAERTQFENISALITLPRHD